MSQNIRTFEITIGLSIFDGQECKDPVVDIVGHDDLVIKCIDKDKGTYVIEFPNGVGSPTFTVHVTCPGSDCGPITEVITICDSVDDCSDCEVCHGGMCVSACEEGQSCDDGICVNCTDDSECTGGQVCVNGNCQCPTGTVLNANGTCDQCSDDSDCTLCETCTSVNGTLTCTPKNCSDGSVCDLNTGDCVDCLNSGDCGINEICLDNECVCSSGYVRENGKCILPPDCARDSDCPDCLICVNSVCQPMLCPAGKVCVDGDCVPECVDGGCSSDSEYCSQTQGGPSVCVQCEGSCEGGCVFPCICDPIQNICINNPCSGSCSDGAAGCGSGSGSTSCGCLDGECVPCVSLDCLGVDCDRALGCECFNGNCIDSDDSCASASCSSSSDCGLGCTCSGGECISCGNFSCETGDCSSRDGCGCVGGECKGDSSDECTDLFTIEKDDLNCTLTGSLIKDNCCSCPKLTADTKGKSAFQTDDSITIDFLAELRKGAYNNVSVETNVRLDDFADENIAENEPPLSGSMSLSYTITKLVYKLEPGEDEILGTPDDVRIYVGRTTSNPVVVSSAFVGGQTAEVKFNGITLPKIGFEERNGDSLTVVDAVDISIKISSALVFFNNCIYPAGTVVSNYAIRHNSNYALFTAVYGNTKAKTISSPNCKLPFFKWTKSDTSGLMDPPFRKLYIEGNGTYIDTFGHPEELDSCKYYLLESDCTCQEDPSDWIVLCNPSDIDYELNLCNKEFTLKNFVTCDVNQDITFRIQAGTIDETFLGANPPNDIVLTSQVRIEEIIYSIACDIEGDCTKTYIVPFSEPEIVPELRCLTTGEFKVTFPPADATGLCAVEKIEIGSSVLTSNLTKNLPFGSYVAVVYWACGCDPTEIPIEEFCCAFDVPAIARVCGGGIVCEQADYLEYSVSGEVQSDICDYVSNLGTDDSALISVSRGNCDPKTIEILGLSSQCCDGLSFELIQIDQTTSQITVTGYFEPTVVLTSGNGVVTQSGNVFTISDLTPGVEYGGVISDSTIDCADQFFSDIQGGTECNDVVADLTINGCNDSLNINISNASPDGTWIAEQCGITSPISVMGGAGATVMNGPIDCSTLTLTSPTGCVVSGFGIDLVQSCSPDFSFNCIGGTGYDVLFYGCNITMLEVLSGTGAVSGNTVFGAEQNDPPTVRVTTDDGCFEDFVDVVTICETPSVTPTPTRTVTITPSLTRSPSPTPSESSAGPVTPTPTETPTATPTPTPSISVSAVPSTFGACCDSPISRTCILREGIGNCGGDYFGDGTSCAVEGLACCHCSANFLLTCSPAPNQARLQVGPSSSNFCSLELTGPSGFIATVGASDPLQTFTINETGTYTLTENNPNNCILITIPVRTIEVTQLDLDDPCLP